MKHKTELLSSIKEALARFQLRKTRVHENLDDLPDRITSGLGGATQDSLDALRLLLSVLLCQQGEIETLRVDLTNPEQLRANVKAFERIALPWRSTSDGRRHERKLVTGQVVGLVTSDLSEFAHGEKPREHGWGVRGNGPSGYGSCIIGINRVTWNSSMSEAEIVAAEGATLEASKKEIDDFLRRDYPELTLLDEQAKS